MTAREMVMAYGWNSTSYQILNPGIEHWFHPGVPGVVGYTRRYQTMVVAGGPVCPREVLPQVVSAFERFARNQRCRVCYVCAESRLRDLFFQSRDHALVTIGAQPVWDPHGWPSIINSRSSLRAQPNRSRNKGVAVEAIPPEEGCNNPQLGQVLAQWLKSRRLPPLHFLVEPETLKGIVADRVVLVASYQRKPLAYLVASPIFRRNGYLIEQVVRGFHAPNGTSELLIDAAMRRFAAEGRKYVTLGLVALSNNSNNELMKNPFWLRALMLFARAHACRFYNFRGLERFRTKMAPDRWDNVYAISNESRFSALTLYAVGKAFSGISPWQAIAIGIARAVAEEARRFGRRADQSLHTSQRLASELKQHQRHSRSAREQ